MRFCKVRSLARVIRISEDCCENVYIFIPSVFTTSDSSTQATCVFVEEKGSARFPPSEVHTD